MPTHSLDLESSSSQYASIADASQTGLDLSGDNTIAFWVKPESLPGSGSVVGLITKDGIGTTSNRSYSVDLYNNSGTHTIRFFMSANAGGSTFTEITFTHELTVGVWTHIAIVTDISNPASSRSKLYINGKDMGNGSSATAGGGAGSIFNGNAPFVIGRYDGASVYFDGLIKDVRVFSDIRTASEIASDAHTESVSDAALEGEWNLNNDYTDGSGNSNTLTATNSPVFSTNIPWEKPGGISGSDLETDNQAYWEFNNDVTDENTNGNNLTANNSPTYGTGLNSDNALDLEESSSQSASITDAAQTGLETTGDFSVAGFMQLEQLPSAAGASFSILSKDNLTSREHLIEVNNSDNTLRVLFWNSGGSLTQVRTTSALTSGSWIHFVVSVDVSQGAAGVKIFLDGVEVATTTMNNSATAGSTGTANVYVGATLNGATVRNFFDGLLYRLGFWNSALGYGEALDLYNDGSGLSWSGTTTTQQALTASITGAVSIDQIINKVLTTSIAGSATITNTKSFIRNLTAAVSGSAAVQTANYYFQNLTANMSAAATIAQESIKTVMLTATISVQATISNVKSFTRTLTANTVASATIDQAKNIYRTLTANMSAAATVGAVKTFYQTLTAAVTATATVVRGNITFSRTLTAIIKATAKLNEYFYKAKYTEEDEDYKRKY